METPCHGWARNINSISRCAMSVSLSFICRPSITSHVVQSLSVPCSLRSQKSASITRCQEKIKEARSKVKSGASLHPDYFDALDVFGGKCELFGLKIFFHMLRVRGTG